MKNEMENNVKGTIRDIEEVAILLWGVCVCCVTD